MASSSLRLLVALLCSEKRRARRQQSPTVPTHRSAGEQTVSMGLARAARRQIALSPLISAKDVAHDESYADEQKDYSCQSDSKRAISVAGRRDEETNNDTPEAD
ncbi:hypothetical protein CN217_17845 [Sinorhizobium meliloti]|nr:hypothetical protein EBB04_24350 [Sinorhizobium meliloti]RVH09528.1 hypothetical protein CN217_17845 [Sinorhizobium meliloti]